MAGLAVESESGGNSAIVLSRLQRSDEIIRWVHSNLDGTKIPALPSEKRVQLAAACWHVAIDHQMAIVVLVHETLHASASRCEILGALHVADSSSLMSTFEFAGLAKDEQLRLGALQEMRSV